MIWGSANCHLYERMNRYGRSGMLPAADPWLRMSERTMFAGNTFTVTDPGPSIACSPCDVPVDNWLLPGRTIPNGAFAVAVAPYKDWCIDPDAPAENITPNRYMPIERFEIAATVEGEVSTYWR
jgi:hypothetical protein